MHVDNFLLVKKPKHKKSKHSTKKINFTVTFSNIEE